MKGRVTLDEGGVSLHPMLRDVIARGPGLVTSALRVGSKALHATSRHGRGMAIDTQPSAHPRSYRANVAHAQNLAAMWPEVEWQVHINWPGTAVLGPITTIRTEDLGAWHVHGQVGHREDVQRLGFKAILVKSTRYAVIGHETLDGVMAPPLAPVYDVMPSEPAPPGGGAPDMISLIWGDLRLPAELEFKVVEGVARTRLPLEKALSWVYANPQYQVLLKPVRS